MSEPQERELGLLRQRVVDLEADNFALRERVQRLEQLRADISLSGFVHSLALDVALGEATMPDHVVTPVAISASTYLVPNRDGIGLRFHTPELGDASALSSTSLELAKVPAPEGRAPRSLYAILQQKQLAYGAAAGSGDLEGRLIAEIGKVLAESGAWTMPFLAAAAARIGELELKLAADEERSKAATALVELARSLVDRVHFVAGDLHSLAAALDATTPGVPQS
ncbi:MAG TPA: hypothetical protein VGJ23_03165 [Gaiellaceae bacterium]